MSDTTSKSAAIRHDAGKLRYDLLPPCALRELVKIYTIGSIKYPERNWEKGIEWNRLFAAVQRHLWKFWDGIDHDDESGLLHVAHAAWGCLALIHHYYFHKKLDNRPIKRRGKQSKTRISNLCNTTNNETKDAKEKGE